MATRYQPAAGARARRVDVLALFCLYLDTAQGRGVCRAARAAYRAWDRAHRCDRPGARSGGEKDVASAGGGGHGCDAFCAADGGGWGGGWVLSLKCVPLAG